MTPIDFILFLVGATSFVAAPVLIRVLSDDPSGVGSRRWMAFSLALVTVVWLVSLKLTWGATWVDNGSEEEFSGVTLVYVSLVLAGGIELILVVAGGIIWKICSSIRWHLS